MLDTVHWSDIPNVELGRRKFFERNCSNRMRLLFIRGGKFSPVDCQSRQELAIIIPYRNREYHLKLLTKYLHPFLQRQQRSYQIFVVEQVIEQKNIRRKQKI